MKRLPPVGFSVSFPKPAAEDFKASARHRLAFTAGALPIYAACARWGIAIIFLGGAII